ncbi:leucine rich adaptor protein 1 isoform X2 [Micropterus salmoides]|uniref:leucine rich adaptor protein 1 isoform X2 n=1 Tax=Micropterus salmoides TaxID=27706 RepID=UPI0018EBB289|nr:leucine rich adaptor protein 1 isoform X2 [Micropterus salmoides]
MDEGTASETIPDLKDIEVKIGRKTPEGLLRWMREDASSLRGDAKLTTAHDTSKETGTKSLDEKIRKLKLEMAHLRSVDVKILQQLLAVHEGIEAVKWLLEERSTLTSRCSSLTSSQYSLGEGPDTSWRGSWSSLQDPNDKLDNISIGSYLDTLADDMDEYCPSSSESVICPITPLVSEAAAGGRIGGGPGATVTAAGTGAGVELRSGIGPESGIWAGANENGTGIGNCTEVKGGPGTGVTSAITGTGIAGRETGKSAVPVSSPQAKSEGSKQAAPVWTKVAEIGKGSPVSKNNTQTQTVKANGVLEKATMQTGSPAFPGLNEKLGTNQSPKLKPYKNGKIDMDTCKMNGRMHLEYDAHWRYQNKK